MIPSDCILGGREGLNLEHVEHWRLYRSFQIFSSNLPGWGPKNQSCIYLPKKYSQVCCPSICSLKNFPFRSFDILHSYFFLFALVEKKINYFMRINKLRPPPHGVWFCVKSVCHPGVVGTFQSVFCYHFLTKLCTGVHSFTAL